MGSFDLVVLVLLVPQPVLVEPVVNLSLHVKVVSEVRRSGRSDPEFRLLIDELVVDELLVFAFIVLLHDTKGSSAQSYNINQSVSQNSEDARRASDQDLRVCFCR